MVSPESRKAERIACEIPVRLQIGGMWHEVVVVDASRTGVRLRMTLEDLDVPEGAGLGAVAAYLERALPRRAPAQFHPERLGGLVERNLTIVRIAITEGALAHVEVGCRLDRPLNDIEVAALGLPLPPEGQESGSAVRRRVRTGSLHADAHSTGANHARPLKRFRVVVTGREASRQDPLVSTTDEVSDVGVVLRLRDPLVFDCEAGSGDVRELAAAFTRQYGPMVDLAIHEGSVSVFRGPAKLVRIETVAVGSDVLEVGFAFGRALEPAERRALRLA